VKIMESAYHKQKPNELDVMAFARSVGKFRLPSDRFLAPFVRIAPRKFVRLAVKINEWLTS